MIPAKIYSITIPASGAFPLLVSGSMVKVLSATSTFRLAGDVFGEVGAIQAGQGIRLDATDPKFGRLIFTDTSGAVNNLQVLVADDTFIDDRITGEVSVIDGSKAQTLADMNFMRSMSVTSGAALVPAVGLQSSATKRILIKSITFSASVDGNVRVGQYAITPRVAGVPTAWGTSNQGWSTKIPTGITAPTLCSATILSGGFDGGEPVFRPFEQFAVKAGVTITRTYDRPIMLVANGSGLAVDFSVVASTLNVGFQWIEELDA